MSTLVSKTNPTIKKILASTVPGFKGRKIYVSEVDPHSFNYHLIEDTGEPYLYVADAAGYSGFRIQPGYGQARLLPFPNDGRNGEVFVTHRIGEIDSITIYAPIFDTVQMDIARDALMSGKSEAANLRELLKPFGRYAGIAEAVLEAQAKLLEKASKGKRSKQLDREIEVFLRSRQ